LARTYTLRKRAEQQAQTRQRIVEAAVDLHGTVGPAKTTFSMVAERAGVQRHTLYAHFPDERSLLQACSGMHGERHPMPDAAAWRDIADRRQRLTTGLHAIYRWFGENAQLLSCVLRDAETDPLVAEIGEQSFGRTIAVWHEVLGETLDPKVRPMLALALSFYTFRTLVLEAGMTGDDAVTAMVRTIEAA
jgi:AcrR family transcriptional regulator